MDNLRGEDHLVDKWAQLAGWRLSHSPFPSQTYIPPFLDFPSTLCSSRGGLYGCVVIMRHSEFSLSRSVLRMHSSPESEFEMSLPSSLIVDYPPCG